MLENFNIWLFLLCFAIVYIGIGLLGAFCVIYAANRSKKSIRDFVVRDLEEINLPAQVMVALFFTSVILGWPFILKSTLKEGKQNS